MTTAHAGTPLIRVVVVVRACFRPRSLVRVPSAQEAIQLRATDSSPTHNYRTVIRLLSTVVGRVLDTLEITKSWGVKL